MISVNRFDPSFILLEHHFRLPARPKDFNLEAFLRKHLVRSKEPEADAALIALLVERDANPEPGVPQPQSWFWAGSLVEDFKFGVPDERILDVVSRRDPDLEWHQLAELVARQTPVQARRGLLSTSVPNIAYVSREFVASVFYTWKQADWSLRVRKRLGVHEAGAEIRGKPYSWPKGAQLIFPD